MNIVTRIILSSSAIALSAYILPGVSVNNFLTAVIVAVVLGTINMFVKPIILFLTLPITLVTLGLFTLVINALLVILTSYLVPGFSVENFWWALLFSIVVSFISSFLSHLAKN